MHRPAAPNVPAPAKALGRVLVIAGSDSGGGAGIQADVKAITAMGGFAMTAIAALTAQNTHGVFGVEPVSPRFLRAQITAIASDLGWDAVKTGMLAQIPLVEAAAEALAGTPAPVIVDPVMIATSGARLLEPRAVDALRALLIPRAALVTPNAPEAAALTGRNVDTREDQRRAADRLLEAGAKAALVKGGHVDGARVYDVLATQTGEHIFEADRIPTPRPFHGAGCTLASAIAAGLARGAELISAIDAARDYLRGAMLHAPDFGTGARPLNHAWRNQPAPYAGDR